MNPLKDFQPEIKILFIAVIIVVVLSVGGILLLKTTGLEPAPSPTPPAQQIFPPAPELQPQPEVLDTSGWQTYRNDEFGFEVKYPEGWGVSASKGAGAEGTAFIRFSDPHSNDRERKQISLYINDSPTVSIEEYIDTFMAGFDYYVSSLENTSIGNIPAKKVVLGGGDVANAEPYVGFLMLESGKLYRWDGTDQNILAKILSTFRFTPTSKSVSTGVTREITITAKKNQWRFMPEEFEVSQGDRVVLTVLNEDDYDHGFAIDLFGISQRIQGNSIIKVEFVADQAGDFPFYSSVPSGGGIVDGKERTYYDMAGQMHVRSLIPRTK